MAASLIIEEQHGTYRRRAPRHDGYYAGDFSGVLDAGVRRTSGSRHGARSTSTSVTLPASRTAAPRVWG